jgi:hypothetical protein
MREMKSATEKPPDPGNEKAALAGGDLKANQCDEEVPQDAGKFKWKRSLELALDAVTEAKSRDLGLLERNLVEAATEMLRVASEIRSRLWQ